MSSRRDLSDTSGFTLVEVLVAFVMLAILSSVLFRGAVSLRTGAVAFDARSHAEIVARAILDQALSQRDLISGSTSGVRDGRRWAMRATTVDLTAQLPTPPVDDTQPQSPGQATPGGVPTQVGPGQPAPGQDPLSQSLPQKPQWMTQRLVVDVDTGASPVEVEAIRLVKAQ